MFIVIFLSYGIFKCLVDVVCRLHTVVYSLLGWTTRGRHHTPVFRMFDWPLHRDFSLLFAISEVGSFTCIGCDSPIHGTDGLESPPKDLAMRIKRLAKGRYCRGGIWTHAEPPVWKFAVYTLALRPLGHDSSSFIVMISCNYQRRFFQVANRTESHIFAFLTHLLCFELQFFQGFISTHHQDTDSM